MKLGYARVSTQDQNLTLQTDALLSAGAKRIFTDTATGSNTDRPGFKELFDHVREGDCVVVWRLDRIARSLKDLIDLAAGLERRGAQLISLHENIDTTTTTGKLFFHIFGPSPNSNATSSSNAPKPASPPPGQEAAKAGEDPPSQKKNTKPPRNSSPTPPTTPPSPAH